ncbi:hypothetical protein CYMTET_55201 [Cymbomonas tetramitiformis]|uniref:Uncharacterized protein n=1 Tax=Cymbomonas tetramitiformis TaxID=36881 RepID=A0AAE0ENB0_9CHLO|nr:hypothetical protein CYMTET_55201 [Cymbomonas tetramitiformis]
MSASILEEDDHARDGPQQERSFDERMRTAYTHFQDFVRRTDATLTPAYDPTVLAFYADLLMGVSIPDILTESSIPVRIAWQAEMLRLGTVLGVTGIQGNKPYYSIKNVTVRSRAPPDVSTTYNKMEYVFENELMKKSLLAITDFGEDADDEVFLVILCGLWLRHNMGITLHICFTHPDFLGQLRKLRAFLDLPDPLEVGDLSDFTTKNIIVFDVQQVAVPCVNLAKGPLDVFIIGPLYDRYCEYVQDLVKKAHAMLREPPRYFLGGDTRGSALNYKPEISAQFFDDACKWKGECYAIDYAGGQACSSFHLQNLSSVRTNRDSKPVFNSAIVAHVLKIAFRNTVGRASPRADNFVIGLLLPNGKGANYNTVLNFYKDSFAEMSRFDEEEVKYVLRHHKQMELPVYQKCLQKALWYYREMMNDSVKRRALKQSPIYLHETDNEVTMRFAVAGVEPIGFSFANFREALEGYADVLFMNHVLFECPIEVIESGYAENWQPVWDTVDESSPVHRFETCLLIPEAYKEISDIELAVLNAIVDALLTTEAS